MSDTDEPTDDLAGSQAVEQASRKRADDGAKQQVSASADRQHGKGSHPKQGKPDMLRRSSSIVTANDLTTNRTYWTTLKKSYPDWAHMAEQPQKVEVTIKGAHCRQSGAWFKSSRSRFATVCTISSRLHHSAISSTVAMQKRCTWKASFGEDITIRTAETQHYVSKSESVEVSPFPNWACRSLQDREGVAEVQVHIAVFQGAQKRDTMFVKKLFSDTSKMSRDIENVLNASADSLRKEREKLKKGLNTLASSCASPIYSSALSATAPIAGAVTDIFSSAEVILGSGVVMLDGIITLTLQYYWESDPVSKQPQRKYRWRKEGSQSVWETSSTGDLLIRFHSVEGLGMQRRGVDLELVVNCSIVEPKGQISVDPVELSIDDLRRQRLDDRQHRRISSSPTSPAGRLSDSTLSGHTPRASQQSSDDGEPPAMVPSTTQATLPSRSPTVRYADPVDVGIAHVVHPSASLSTTPPVVQTAVASASQSQDAFPILPASSPAEINYAPAEDSDIEQSV